MKINAQVMGFGRGTKVLMADGTEKEIENIKSGDTVLSFDQFNAFGLLEPKKVLNTFMHVDRNLLKITTKDAELVVAPGQLFIDSKSDWQEAVDTNELIDETGQVVSFEVEQIKRGKYQVFDIIVEDNHSLIANGIRVHNKKKKKKRAGAARKVTTDDYDENEFQTQGTNRTKKRNRNYVAEPKIDNIATIVSNINSIKVSTDFLTEIIETATPIELTQIKLTIQTSIDNLYNYVAAINVAATYSSMSAYDKAEAIAINQDINSAAIAVRKPFQETVVSAAGKNIALALLDLIDLSTVKINRITSLYTFDPKDVEEKTKPKKKLNASKAINKNGLNKNPNFSQRQEGGSRNDFGSDRGRGGGSRNEPAGPSRSSNSKTPGTETRAPAKQGPGPGPNRTSYGGYSKAGAPGGDPDKADRSGYNTRGRDKAGSIKSGSTPGGI